MFVCIVCKNLFFQFALNQIDTKKERHVVVIILY